MFPLCLSVSRNLYIPCKTLSPLAVDRIERLCQYVYVPSRADCCTETAQKRYATQEIRPRAAPNRQALVVASCVDTRKKSCKPHKRSGQSNVHLKDEINVRALKVYPTGRRKRTRNGMFRDAMTHSI